MQKFITLLISCSLGLAGAAMAQQPDQQSSPKKGKATATEKATGTEKPHATGAGAGVKAGGGANAEKKNIETGTPKPHEHEKNMHGVSKTEKTGVKAGASTATGENVSGQTGVSPTPGGKHQAEQGKKGKQGGGANANAKVSPAPAPTASASVAPTGAAATTGAASTTNTATNAGAAQQNANIRGGKAGAAMKKPDPQVVQQIKTQHANFHAQPRPDRAPAVTFNANFRIEGSDRWQGQQYEVFRSYHPEQHDRDWYHSRYQRVELIGGGYYYWNSGYWYPAWGYDHSAEYYAYDGPIYVGHRAEPPDKVIADVQSELQQMGYYQGEVDGLLGPITRQALTAYQADHGLAETAAIDEPTLDSLELG